MPNLTGGCNVEKIWSSYSIGTRVYVFKHVYRWIVEKNTLICSLCWWLIFKEQVGKLWWVVSNSVSNLLRIDFLLRRTSQISVLVWNEHMYNLQYVVIFSVWFNFGFFVIWYTSGLFFCYFQTKRRNIKNHWNTFFLMVYLCQLKELSNWYFTSYFLKQRY